MNQQQCYKAAIALDDRFIRPLAPGNIRQDPDGTSPHHLRWMVSQIAMWTVKSEHEEKSMRWLGYIQGVLVGHYAIPLEAMKQISKEAVS